MKIDLDNFDPQDPKKEKVIPIQPLIDPNNLDDSDPYLTFNERAYIQALKKDPSQQQYQQEVISMLEKLQGNILKGHDRDHAILFFLRFKPNKQQQIKQQMATFVDYVTTYRLQMQEWRLYHNNRIPGGSFGNFFLTARGYYALLGEPKEGFEDFKKKLIGSGFSESFVNGMQKAKLNDPKPESWETPYQNPENIHAMILIADDDKSILGQKVRLVLRDVLQVGHLADIIAVEKACQLRGDNQEPIEHFGFRDGISNPMFLATDEEKINKYGGVKPWDPWASLSVALKPDPLIEKEENCYGSYLVYRKYEQHVRTFEVVVRNLAKSLGMNSEAEEDLETVRGLILGRFKNGTPITLKPTPYNQAWDNNYNNFTYDDDPGLRCPFQAHIRRTNPRLADYRKYRIVRRGMTYGTRNREQEKSGLTYLPNTGIGLLFMSFQSELENFEYIHREMVNNPDFKGFKVKNTGLDALIGQPDDPQSPPPQKWPLSWGKGSFSYSNAISSCITFKGGEYFFAPSICFLKSLAPSARTQSQPMQSKEPGKG
jgi:Dyp-type peroxidase family